MLIKDVRCSYRVKKNTYTHQQKIFAHLKDINLHENGSQLNTERCIIKKEIADIKRLFLYSVRVMLL